MAAPKYQYSTSPRKLEPNFKTTKKKKDQIRIVKNTPQAEVKLTKEQKRRNLKLFMAVIGVFVVLLTISYRNSQIDIKFNYMQAQRRELSSLQKENEQLTVNIENSLNLSNIEREAREKLGMQKLTNRQTVYISLPKTDFVESASERILMEEESEGWFQRMLSKIM